MCPRQNEPVHQRPSVHIEHDHFIVLRLVDHIPRAMQEQRTQPHRALLEAPQLLAAARVDPDHATLGAHDENITVSSWREDHATQPQIILGQHPRQVRMHRQHARHLPRKIPSLVHDLEEILTEHIVHTHRCAIDFAVSLDRLARRNPSARLAHTSHTQRVADRFESVKDLREPSVS